MKHLIIIGPQQSGKTLLGNWITANTTKRQVAVFDCLTKDQLLEEIKHVHVRPPYHEYIPNARVFITNEDISYLDVDKEKFLIIKLNSFL